MTIPRRTFLRIAAGAGALPIFSRPASALDYPTRPVRMIFGFPAGGPGDIQARLLGKWLPERLGQPFIVENRPGAGGNVATETVVRSPPDGYTLLIVTSANALNATLYENLNFNFIRDIAPVASIGRTPYAVLINPSVPAKTIPEFIAYAKANPGKINMASAGNGTAPRVFGALFMAMTGVDMLHVPYRGSYYPDLIGGQVQVVFGAVPASLGYVQAGKLRALAVTTATRSAALPDVPSLGDFLPGYDASIWQGIGAPAKTPPEIIAALNKQVNAALADPTFKARLFDLGMEPFASSPAEFGKFIADETEKWAKVIRTANIKAE